jgi:hypothetical protein
MVEGSERVRSTTGITLQSKIAIGFHWRAVWRCPPETQGIMRLWRIRQRPGCDRDLDSGIAIHRNGDWRLERAAAHLGQAFPLPVPYANDAG